MSNLIELREVGVWYKKKVSLFRTEKSWGLRNVSLQVKRGETLGVIGGNGAGKSTLLKLLSGILDPDEGKVLRKVRNISLLTLGLGFLPNLSGRDNAVLSGILLGKTKDEMRNLLDDIIDFSEIGDAINDPVRTYSSGMRARLSFATALKADSDMILVDELLGVGDRQFRKKSTQAMKEQISSEKTVVIVSHNEELIKEVCDRLIWIDAGTIKAQGSVEEVRKQYHAK
jgi:lipopolysaccharide transport system ATP-binding protein